MSHTIAEIQNQPNSWRQTIDTMTQRWSELSTIMLPGTNTHYMFVGCGTSFYLAQSAARLTQEMTGCTCVAVPGSEVFLADESVIPTGVPVVAVPISRSGTSSEVVLAVEHLKQQHPEILIVGVTCHSQETLAKQANIVISLDFAAEESVIMTQSFTNMLLAIQWLAAKSAKRDDVLRELDRLPELLAGSMTDMAMFAQKLGHNEKLQQFVFLGLGRYYGLAAEATLKLKEMTQTPCEYYNPLEFRHGPISIVRDDTATVVIAGNHEMSHIQRLAKDIAKFGATVAAIQPDGEAVTAISLPLPGRLSDWSRSVLYMPSLQLLAYERAILLGLDPDKPRNLSQVVVL